MTRDEDTRRGNILRRKRGGGGNGYLGGIKDRHIYREKWKLRGYNVFITERDDDSLRYEEARQGYI